MDILTWLLVGLIAGVLASYAIGGIGYGILGDIVVGMLGAVIGSWLFGVLHITNPIRGLPGTIAVAFIGSLVLLLIVRAIRRPRRVL
jgi:uncharacterized membrane protein YeaQ/YmgE (transglycosylase-associated protein family)